MDRSAGVRAVFALTASLRPRRWRWEPTFRVTEVTEGAADLYLWTEVQVCDTGPLKFQNTCGQLWLLCFKHVH